jgi:hypothetical protein
MPLGFDWITSHTFREAAATPLDEGGRFTRSPTSSVTSIASMTQNVYFGRRQASERAGTGLDVSGRTAVRMGKPWDGGCLSPEQRLAPTCVSAGHPCGSVVSQGCR